MKLGVIGCGNMGGAMIRMIVKAGILQPEEILAADISEAQRKKLEADTGIQTTSDNCEAAKSGCLLLAVKPQFLPEVAAQISSAIGKNTLLLSIVAGYSLKMLGDALKNQDLHIIRIMPNTPAMVGEGVLAVCRNDKVTKEEWQFAFRLLSCMGLAEEVRENLMDAVTGVSGSSPAFVFLFLEALADAGVRAGLPRAMAQRFAAQVLMGSGKLALETGLHPGALKDMVTSPAGTTIEGVAALEKRAFRSAVMEAVDAAVQKSKSLAK
ncbi:MAG: pyrroline-5-carboxylate reductase [Clostridia bacterium]|nr:pyrroline-5-carboxylate reductase [Clostridia bacterium]